MGDYNTSADLARIVGTLQEKVTQQERWRPHAAVAVESAEVSTASTTAVDFGGPSLTIVARNFAAAGVAFIDYMVDVEMNRPTDPFDAQVLAYLDGASVGTILNSGSVAYERRGSSQGTATGTTSLQTMGWLSIVTTPGLHTLELRYLVTGGSAASFRNRRLFARSL